MILVLEKCASKMVSFRNIMMTVVVVLPVQRSDPYDYDFLRWVFILKEEGIKKNVFRWGFYLTKINTKIFLPKV